MFIFDTLSILTKSDSFDEGYFEGKGYLIPQITPWRCLILTI